jgi:hypothetical protein
MTAKNIKKCGANMACGDSPQASCTANDIRPGLDARLPGARITGNHYTSDDAHLEFMKHKP